MLPYRLWRWRNEVSQVANELATDKYLIWAIMDRETLCGDAPGYEPKGSAQGLGDGGHGHGLMQIDDRSHPDFCSDISKWGDPYQNVFYAINEVYRPALKRAKGYEPAAIAQYNAGWAKKDYPWIRELLARDPQPSVATLDRYTTNNNYVSDVLQRRLTFTRLGEGNAQS